MAARQKLSRIRRIAHCTTSLSENHVAVYRKVGERARLAYSHCHLPPSCRRSGRTEAGSNSAARALYVVLAALGSTLRLSRDL
jgi:hypothetical protein